MSAITAASLELREVVGDGKGNPIPNLDKVAAHQFSAPTREKIDKVFGVGTPITFARAAAPKGKVRFNFSVPSGSKLQDDDQDANWSALNLHLLLDSAGRTMTSSGAWDSLTTRHKAATLAVSAMALEGKHVRGPDDIWRGKMRFSVASVKVEDAAKPFAMQLDGISLESTTVARGKAYDVIGAFRIKTIKTMGEQIDGLGFSMRWKNVDLKAMEELTEAFRRRSGNGTAEQQLTRLTQLNDMAPQLRAYGKSIAQRGTTIIIDDISAGYGGHRASLKGSVGLARTVESDFDSFTSFCNKIVARFDVRVPVALLKTIARNITRKQMAAKEDGSVSAEALEMSSQGVTDIMVGQALASGYVRKEKDVLMARIDFTGGQIRVNGKALVLPKFPVKKTPPAAPQAE